MSLRQFLKRQTGWNVRYGVFWMIQWQVSWWASLGIHIDPKRRKVSSGPYEGWTYGPYVDFHCLFFVLSLGWHPYLSGELQSVSGVARGGVSVPTNDDLSVEKVAWKWRTFVELMLIAMLALNIYGTYWRIARGGWLP